MKKRTFTQRWNATALRRIKRQFVEATDKAHLCSASYEFESLWKDHKEEIRDIARNLHIPHAIIRSQDFGNCLFYSNGDLTFTEWCFIRKQVRIDFLNHEIKRLTSK